MSAPFRAGDRDLSAADGIFPYPHRTMAEVWADAELRSVRKAAYAASTTSVLTWCEQCEMRVTAREADACRARFCAMRRTA